MDAFMGSFLSTLGILSACGVCAALFAAVDFMYDLVRNGVKHSSPVWFDNVPPEWHYESKKMTRTESDFNL